MDSENHVTGMVVDAGVRMCCNVIEELVACFRDHLGSIGLSCRNCDEGSEEVGVDCSSVEEKRSVPTMFWTRLICSGVRGGDLSSSTL